MAVYIGPEECRVIYVAKNGQQLRVSSIWVGDQQVFPPANRQEIHLFTRNTQGYGRYEHDTFFNFAVPVPWWATSADVVILGAGEKGRDGTKSFTGGSDGNGGRSGAWVVKTIALTQSSDAVVRVGKGTSTSPHATEVILPGVGGQADVRVHDGEGPRTANSGSAGGNVTPISRTEHNQIHTGGYGGGRGNPGGHPGGGGGGGQGSGLIGNPTSGREGGDGYVWLRFRSDAPIGGGGFTLYLGVTSGAADQAIKDWAVSIGKTYQTITEITVPVEIIAPSMYSAFSGCKALTSVPEMDASQVTDVRGLFSYCESLTSVPPLDMRNAQQVSYMLTRCLSLASVTLPRMGESFITNQTLDMRDTKLDAAAANALMASLGTPPPGGNLQLPSTAAGADTSIAAAKNWTVTIG